MTPLYIVVEGQTEEAFVSDVLREHLVLHSVHATPIVVTTSRARNGTKRMGGGSNWDHWRRDIGNVLRDRRPVVRVTTLLDLYALPTNMPGLPAAASEQDSMKRCAALESAMATAINDPRFLPYIQRHEVESLVLAALPSVEKTLETAQDREGLKKLTEEIINLLPEDVNDGAETAPSKRLENAIPSYRKTVHGPLALADAGIAAVRKQCPRFHAWVEALERLGTLGKSAS